MMNILCAKDAKCTQPPDNGDDFNRKNKILKACVLLIQNSGSTRVRITWVDENKLKRQRQRCLEEVEQK